LTLLFGLLAFAGCAAWFIYNGVIFHDPFAFFDGAYSAATQQQSIQASSGLPTHHNLWLSIHVYLQAAVDSIGLPLAILAMGGMLWWVCRERLRTESLIAYLVLVPFAFNVAALFLGISILETPEINLGIPTYFNVRYGMEMIPAAALFLAFLVTRWRGSTPIMLGIVVLLCVSSSTLMSRSSTPYVVRDPLYGVGSVARSEGLRAGDWLAQHYTGGNVLITYSHDSAIMFNSRAPDTAFVTEANGVYFQQALATPQAHVAWIIMSPNAGTVNEVTAALAPRQDWRKYFVLRTTIGYTQFWERKANS
ncbi:MAG TPA: hypothetical protein VE338_16290, partial [Ktedonobacterales bacterium]|jgi:hypothetical protein|nr:hypothetical protein [Ktedonobacterales bacterium]